MLILNLQGLEIYSNENNKVPHIYLSFPNELDRDKLYSSIIKQPELKLKNVQQDVMTLKWQNGVISNFEYLMYINRFETFISTCKKNISQQSFIIIQHVIMLFC